MNRSSICLILFCAWFLVGVGCSQDPTGEDDNEPLVLGDATGGGADAEASGTDAEPDDQDGESVTDAESDGQTGGEDTGGTEDDGGSLDASDGAGADGGECSQDDDADGLNNCEESRLCTDPNDGDTDGDSLSDLEELQNQTDPCKTDSDGDGASDKEELDFGFDPNRPDPAEDQWILNACDEPDAEPVNFHKSATGNWTIALPPAFNNYTELKLTNTTDPEATAVYDDTANEVAGYLLSKKSKTGNNSPSDPLRNSVRNALTAQGNVIQDQTGGEFDTHDEKKAAIGRYLVQLTSSKSTRKVRDDLLFQLAPFSKSDAKGLPNSSGAQYTKFRVFVSVIFRENKNGADQSLVSLAVAPAKKYDNIDKVKFRMDDLTNTTNIAEQVDSHLVKCTRFKPGKGTPKAEFYWVLDSSGSMSDDHQKVQSFASKFEKELRNTALDYRLGVTNMSQRNGGRMQVPPSWHTNSNTFKNQIKVNGIRCRQACSGGREYGMVAAKAGLKYMLGQATQQPTAAERIRSNAQVITIFMSDEEAQSIETATRRGTKSFSQAIQQYRTFFKGRTTAFAIVSSGGSGCPTENGKAYKEIALETGGKFGSLCANDLTQTIKDIIYAATGLASNHSLPQTPISSSLRVFLNGTWVPRSKSDGFEYFAENNSIAFFGSYRPNQGQGMNKKDDYIAVSYETFKDRCKENSQGSNNCAP